MIRNLLATTALATLVSMGAFAQEATTPAPAPADPAPMVQEAAPVAKADGHLATPSSARPSTTAPAKMPRISAMLMTS